MLRLKKKKALKKTLKIKTLTLHQLKLEGQSSSKSLNFPDKPLRNVVTKNQRLNKENKGPLLKGVGDSVTVDK